MIRSKECFKCKTVKSLEEFYKHLNMKDGHLNKCKECAKLDAISNRNKNIDKVREYDRKRAELPHRTKLRLEVNKKWRSEDKRRQQAHAKVRKAIMQGLLTRQPCRNCGSEKTLAHHEDYDKPLDIWWMCQPCHKQRHKELKKEF